MDKLVGGVVNADVESIFTAAGFEENQIAGKQFIAGHFSANFCLIGGGAWQHDAETIAIGTKNKTGAIDAARL